MCFNMKDVDIVQRSGRCAAMMNCGGPPLVPDVTGFSSGLTGLVCLIFFNLRLALSPDSLEVLGWISRRGLSLQVLQVPHTIQTGASGLNWSF